MQIFFADNLIWLLGAKRMTYRDLAEKLGVALKRDVPYQKVHRLTKGKGVSLEVLGALCEILECSVEDLVFKDLSKDARIVLPSDIKQTQSP